MLNNNSFFPQSDDRLFTYLLTEITKNVIGVGDKTEKEKRGSIAVLIFLGFFAIVGTEPFKVLLRKNIGSYALSINRLVSSCILFFIAGITFYFLPIKFPEYMIEMQYAGTFYILFSFFTLCIGIVEFRKAKSRFNISPENITAHLHRGDSIFFNTANNTKTQSRIWLIVEPGICLFISAVFSILLGMNNPLLMLLGLPLVVTAIAFWFNEWFQIKNIWNVQSKKVASEKEKLYHNQEFNMNERFQSFKTH